MTPGMRARSLVALCAVLLVHFRVAHADPKSDVEKKIKEAMASYDMMDYDASRKLLNQAIATAKKARLDKDPVAARAYLDLGIVAFVNNEQDAAKLSFISAVQIDPKIQIDPAYRSPEMSKLLEQVRSENKGGASASAGNSGGDDGGLPPDLAGDIGASGGGGDCSGVKGLQHEIIDSAKANAPLHVEAMLGSDVHATKVSVMYRPEGSTSFTEIKMTKQGDCKYVAEIPASGMHGSLVHYYVAAYGSNGKPLAEKGSAGSPNIMELTAGGGGGGASPGDDEDPLGGGKSSGGGSSSSSSSSSSNSGGEVSGGTTVTGPKQSKVQIMFSAGSGFGFLQAGNTTEGDGMTTSPVKAAGFGTALAVLQPELDYKLSPQLAIGVAGRLAIPVGANINGHSPLGPAGLLRLRYSLAPSGDGVELMGQLGVGVLRSTLKLDNAMPGMDVDIVAQGPLLIGAGIGYTKHVSSSVSFLADLGALAGIAVTDKVGLAPMNSGVTLDISLGLAFGL